MRATTSPSAFGDPADVTEVLHRAERIALSRERILLMPEGPPERDPGALTVGLGEMCTHGVRFSPRLHGVLWGRPVGSESLS